MNVLMLNADYSPLDIVPWEKAISMLFQDKVRLVEAYAGRMIRSATATFAWPAVVVLKKFAKAGKRVKLNRKTIAARDEYTCQYCGLRPVNKSGRPDMSKLTLDHVIPSSKGGRTHWSNLLLACAPCNASKADRTPAEANMVARKKPKKPSPLDIARMQVAGLDTPVEWVTYIGHLLG